MPRPDPGDRVLRRLRSLAILELANIPFIGWLVFVVAGAPVTAVSMAGFAAFAVLLVQGGSYWILKLRQLRARAPLPAGLRVFALLRVVNPAPLAVVVLVAGYVFGTEPGGGAFVGLVFALVAVGEHVNYFHVQLMHDNAADLRRLRAVGLRPSQLARDLRRR